MANVKIADLAALSASANADVLVVVDASDTTDSAAGSTKKITLGDLLRGLSVDDAVSSPVFLITDAARDASVGWHFFDDYTVWEDENNLTFPGDANPFHVYTAGSILRVEFESSDSDTYLYLECGQTGSKQAAYGLQRGNINLWGWGIAPTSDDLHFKPKGNTTDLSSGWAMILTETKHLKVANTIAPGSGATGSRPSTGSLTPGAQWFDTTLGLPIWWDGANWIDAAGTAV